MRTERRAIVHIGHKKTGTTFIQNQFHASRSDLLDAGVIYPFPEPNHSFALSGLFHQRLGERAPSPRNRYVLDREGSLSAINEELQASEWHTLVLCAESLAGFSREELSAFSKWLTEFVDATQIVFVVRDPVDWAVSVAQQHLKTRGDVERLLNEPEAPRWSNIIRRFAEVFGRGAITVLEYERLAAVRERFAARFALAAGLSPSVAALLQGGSDAVNESLSMEAALLLGRYNARVPETEGGRRNPARSGIEPKAFAGLRGEKFDLPQAARLQAYAQSRDDVAFLAREFGITRYSYSISDIPPSRFTEEVSPAFLDALADRLVGLQGQAIANRLLADAERMRNRGNEAGAAAVLRNAAAQFPTDQRVMRALAAGKGGKGRRVG
ncbi:hypothetical protein SAMN05428950_103378 [Sphingomonas sp. OV641]|uniref:hypothetical protein n=1 Tax=Sphingomonas sp. OV641 TaxID=1881068 RepID=UPI0008C925FD|nr:hypothetical protein [Sphingomonas sp. OV641]SEJ82996.1 hypothetical protein SAMN05428950_103378 [Sphingomonas sp. OV641]